MKFEPLAQRRKRSMWCNSCGHFCLGPLQDTAKQAGCATTKAEAAKWQKYHDLQSNYYFQPVAVETTGVYGKFLCEATQKRAVFFHLPKGNDDRWDKLKSFFFEGHTKNNFGTLCSSHASSSYMAAVAQSKGKITESRVNCKKSKV